MAKRFIQSADVEVSPRGSVGVSLSGPVVLQGEKIVGSATVRLTDVSTLCTRVWIGAPTARHAKGATNTALILVGSSPAGNASGGIPLDPANSAGFYYPANDAAGVYLTGFAAGDAIEFQVFG